MSIVANICNFLPPPPPPSQFRRSHLCRFNQINVKGLRGAYFIRFFSVNKIFAIRN